MKRDINTTGAAARALGARNPVAFDCVHPLEESIRRLAAITDPFRPFEVTRRKSAVALYQQPMVPVPKRPTGVVNARAVRLDWDRIRFEGRWSTRLDGATLEGTMVAHGNSLLVAAACVAVAVSGVSAIVGPGGYWMLGIMVVIYLVAMPLFVAYLGSARVAAEIELERIIGSTIGDPEKYAVRWSRWSDT